MFNFEKLSNTLIDLVDSPDDWLQWGLIFGALFVAFLLRKLMGYIFAQLDSRVDSFCKTAFENYNGLRLYPIMLAFTLGAFHLGLKENQEPCSYVLTVFYLVLVYAAYNLLIAFSNRAFIPKVVGGLIYLMISLSIFGWLSPVKETLRKIKFPLGESSLNSWDFISAVIALLMLLWFVGVLNRLVDTGVAKNKKIPPSVRVLVSKASRLLLYTIAILMSLKIAGVDLRALAFFSGALGLGIGFGLQKVVSNLVSGVIILLDKSIKPGDVIEIDGSYGWINTLRTRYVSVLTRDRKEILIPNEDFVVNKVVNWSFSDTDVRIKADVGIAYGEDVEKAIGCCVQAAKKIERVLGTPAPRCLLTGFGDSAIDLQIRFWINDANEGVANVRSAVLLEVWRSFKENDIRIPFPQRDIHIKGPDQMEALEVALEGAAKKTVEKE